MVLLGHVAPVARNITVKTMLSKMHKSLDDREIGSVIKVKNEKGKYIRQYPGNWD